MSGPSAWISLSDMPARSVLPLLLVGLLSLSPLTWADLVVIVHPDNPVRALKRDQVSDLYLGRLFSFAPDKPAHILDQPRNSPLRKRFFEKLNGMPLLQLNAYWARLQFTGEVQPPFEVKDSQAIIDIVRSNPIAIGYIDAVLVPPSVRVVLRLKE